MWTQPSGPLCLWQCLKSNHDIANKVVPVYGKLTRLATYSQPIGTSFLHHPVYGGSLPGMRVLGQCYMLRREARKCKHYCFERRPPLLFCATSFLGSILTKIIILDRLWMHLDVVTPPVENTWQSFSNNSFDELVLFFYQAASYFPPRKYCCQITSGHSWDLLDWLI